MYVPGAAKWMGGAAVALTTARLLPAMVAALVPPGVGSTPGESAQPLRVGLP